MAKNASALKTTTTGGLVHNRFADATLENGVDDTAGFEGGRIRVAASFQRGVHRLRPFNKKVVTVTRKLDGDEMRCRYGPFKNKLRRVTVPQLDHTANKAAEAAAETAPSVERRNPRGCNTMCECPAERGVGGWKRQYSSACCRSAPARR
jgi:hypothetical protein